MPRPGLERLIDTGRLLEERASNTNFVLQGGGGGGRLLQRRRLFESGRLLDHLRYLIPTYEKHVLSSKH